MYTVRSWEADIAIFFPLVQYKTHAGRMLMLFRDPIWKHIMWSFSIHSALFAHEEYGSI